MPHRAMNRACSPTTLPLIVQSFWLTRLSGGNRCAISHDFDRPTRAQCVMFTLHAAPAPFVLIPFAHVVTSAPATGASRGTRGSFPYPG